MHMADTEALVREKGFMLRRALREGDDARRAIVTTELMKLLPGKTEAEAQELALRLVAGVLHRG